MSAETEIRDDLIARLRADTALAGLVNRIYDGEPAKASPPTLIVGEALGGDWGTKDRDGRELRLSVTIRDTAETAGRIAPVLPFVEDAVRQLGIAGTMNWAIGSALLIRSRIVSPRSGDWTAVLDFRLRALRRA